MAEYVCGLLQGRAGRSADCWQAGVSAEGTWSLGDQCLQEHQLLISARAHSLPSWSSLDSTLACLWTCTEMLCLQASWVQSALECAESLKPVLVFVTLAKQTKHTCGRAAYLV